jgi:hypothetical protein
MQSAEHVNEARGVLFVAQFATDPVERDDLCQRYLALSKTQPGADKWQGACVAIDRLHYPS